MKAIANEDKISNDMQWPVSDRCSQQHPSVQYLDHFLIPLFKRQSMQHKKAQKVGEKSTIQMAKIHVLYQTSQRFKMV